MPSTRESEIRKLFKFTGREFFFAEGSRSYSNNLSLINLETKLFLTSFSNPGFSSGYNSTAFGFNLSIYRVSKNIAEMRTYENGVGETFSCGSAALAVTSLCIKNKFKNISPGGELNFIKKNNANIAMMGQAKYIYSGNIDV